MNLLTISEFLQVQDIKREYLTKDGYFSKQEGFTMIYLQKSKDQSITK
jgi:hypothetical protein